MLVVLGLTALWDSISVYIGPSPKERDKEEKRIDESKNVQKTPTRTYCKCSRPLPYCNQNCRTPRHWKFTQNHRTTRPPSKHLWTDPMSRKPITSFFNLINNVCQNNSGIPELCSWALCKATNCSKVKELSSDPETPFSVDIVRLTVNGKLEQIARARRKASKIFVGKIRSVWLPQDTPGYPRTPQSFTSFKCSTFYFCHFCHFLASFNILNIMLDCVFA